MAGQGGMLVDTNQFHKVWTTVHCGRYAGSSLTIAGSF